AGEPVRPGLALAGRAEQADRMVVADRPRRRADEPGDLADPQSGRGVGAHATAAPRSVGRSSDTSAPASETAASVQSATCMLWMKGDSWRSESPVETPEKIFNSTSVGTAEVTTARTKAIESTAPVFCSISREPAAMPRRCGGTRPIIAAVLGLLN